MRAWFEADKKALKEIKVILIGDAETGKTSLLRRLKDDTYNAKEPQTDGILIEEFAFDKLKTFQKQKQLLARKAYFWDFGGQEIMSATHQFFLTKRSVYMLLLEARRDKNPDQQAREWLERINTSGGNSPVIIVANKIDLNHSFGFNTTDLQKDFPQIVGIVNVSCKSRKGLLKLKTLLAEAIDKAELFQTEIDTRWHGIKDHLRELTAQKQYIRQADFVEICDKCQLPDHEQQQQAIRFLNDLGIVLHFDDLRTSDYFVLDPYWVVTGVYRVITSERAAKNKGNISYEDLHYIFQKEKPKAKAYASEKQKSLRYIGQEIDYIAEIMARFKLCYFMENRERILIPDLLDPDMPAKILDYFEQKQPLQFMYSYGYLPTSTIHFLMVDMQKDIQSQWRTGMYLKSDNNIQAEAFVYASDNKIKILVLGHNKGKYLSLIRYFLSKINQRLNTRIEEFIPVEGKNISYHELVNMKADGEKSYKDYTSKPTKVYSIAELLEGISDSVVIEKMIPTVADQYKVDISSKTMKTLPENTRKVKVFFSYSHKDEAIKDELYKHFSTLSRLGKTEPWHDRKLMGGQDWDATIKKELKEADVILLMISANFIASNYIWDIELKEAIARHHSGEAVVIPIFAKPCDFSGLPFAGLQGYPRDAKFISTQTNKDAAYTEVAKEVRKNIETLFDKLNPEQGL
ncbi:COR domain-containing protein [Flexibacter flexilis]|nr:COR domain-containing protein [Flexibacter flexilis]